MAEFKLERFKYNWKGDWVSNRSYKRDDVVRVNGKSYVCVVTHVSSTAFRTDLTAILPGSNPPQPQPRWTVMTSGRSFENNWAIGVAYNIGDIVVYNGSLWTCLVSHTSANFQNDFSNWTVFALTNSFIGNWSQGVVYSPGSLVKYNGNSYRCITIHTSGATLEDNILSWELYNEGVEIKNSWRPNFSYRVNDLVKYGGSVYKCTQSHISNNTNLDDTKFVLEIPGTQFDDNWNNTTYYNIGDIVKHSGFMYYAINNNFNSKPYADNGSDDWILLSRSYSFVGEWADNAVYKTGDIVLRGGNLYLALRDISSFDSVDNSTLDYLDNTTWELVVPGKSFKRDWTSGVVYSVGDVVYFKGSAYTCNFEHESSIENFPGDNGNIFKYWDILIQAGREGGLRERGDILTYGKSREISYLDSTVFDDSTLGDVRLAIGQKNQLLSVSSELEVYWRNIVEDADAIYVATNGVDDEGRGTAQTPFKTIRYATEYVEDTFAPGTPVVIRVSTGRFEEIGPITVPAGCAVNGDELRSTTVIANQPIPGYQNTYSYIEAYLEHLTSILLDVISGNAIEPQLGNAEEQVILTNVPLIDPETGQQQLDQLGNPIFVSNNFPVSNLTGANRIISLINDYKNFIEFRIASGNTNPALSGSNTLNASQTVANAGEALYLNRKFLYAELIAYLKNNFPQAVLDEERIRIDIWSLLRGFKRDTAYSGNYGTLLSARRYTNAVTGSQLDNLFLMRDSTGLRDLTTEGLQGTLNPPGVFDLYQKPTGGACVSLDPGWGPDDTRVWITNRSPYIQGVTNIGTGCVGKKVDGALHNGGLRSMVSNDFTQVLSDGIGVWVTNNARTELVSVFTYYCQIGYFAEDGGIIRATNGNNSYGRYGAIADGADADEIPQEATIFNRNNEAIVTEAFAGGANDQILLFEYTNAGEEYSQASAIITGAGANASVEFTDFRNGGIFEARLTSPDGSSRKGGTGYLVRQGSAQETFGASSTIKLSQNDPTQFLEEINGMRLLITDGTGVGQYGYVSGYDFVGKTVTVRKESDGTLGWDHIIPGTPLATDLDLTTRYRIEPRVTVSVPPYNTQSYDLFTNRSYIDVTYGNTTQTFNGVTASGRYLWEDDVNNSVTVRNIVSPTAMQFNGQLSVTPTVPFTIQGRISGSITTVTTITANTGTVIETNVISSAGFVEGERIEIIVSSGTGETFDDDPIPAVFNITRAGRSYSATLVNPGAGYKIGDKILILGTALGGTSPANDATITVTSVSLDSTNSIQTFTISGTGRRGKFVALTNAEYFRHSEDGISWVEGSMPFIGNYVKLVNGNNRFIAVAQDEGRVASSLTTTSWTTVNLPLSAAWNDAVYGGGKFILIAKDTDVVASSSDGVTWTTGSIPNDSVGDSTISQWSYVTYGKGNFVAISSNDGATATSTDGVVWTRHDSALPVVPVEEGVFIPASLAYGDNRFVVLDSNGKTAYSFDGITWYRGNDITALTGTWYRLKFDNGVFFAIGIALNVTDPENPIVTTTNICVTSEDGINWTVRTLTNSLLWTALTYGDVNGTGKWVLLASAASTNGINHVSVGARAKLRSEVVTGSFRSIKVWDPGSGYLENTPPTITVVDPNVETEVGIESRIGNGVLAQPEFINRGNGYRKESSVINIIGNGYADIIPEGNVLTLAGIENIPSPGVQIRISGILDLETDILDDLYIFSGVEVSDLGDDGSGNGTRLVRFTITPSVRTENNVQHGTAVTLRERYSQCRITGHDFLDIGTGNFEQTNYPDIYASGNFFVASPENEVYEANAGRVFYTSTDQDGNFRTGELFAVNQATGVVTISAQFFELDGLSELSLGGVRLGGSGTIVNEFSTDGTFAADSNNVIPTQRAIATFLANRLSVGGENLEINRLVAGRVALGGSESEIDNVTNGYLKIPVDVSLQGTFETTDANGDPVTSNVGIAGTIISQMLLLKRYDQSMQ